MKKFISMVMAAAMVVSLVPATAFAANDAEATAKVVGVQEWTESDAKDAKGIIPANKAPELQLKVTDTNYKETNPGTIETEITVTLDGADWRDGNGATLTDDDEGRDLVANAAKFVSVRKDGADKDVDVTSIIVEDTDELTFTLVGALAEDDIIAINLASELTKVKEGHEATVSVSGDLGDFDEMVYATILGQVLEASIKKTVDVAEEEFVTLYSKGLEIEAAVGYLPEEITLKINSGFEFTKACEDATGATVKYEDENELTVTVPAKTTKVVIKDLEIEVTDAKEGDVATIKVSAKDWTAASVDVAVVVEMGLTISVDEDEDVPEMWSGVDAEDTYLNSEDDHTALEITIEEVVAGSYNDKDEIELTLPEGVYVTKVKAVDENSTLDQDINLEEVLEDAYNEGEYKSFIIKKRVLNETEPAGDVHEFTITMDLVADPGFVGDVEVEMLVDGESIGEVTVATFKTPMVVEAAANDVIIDYRNTEIPTTIVVKEAEAGLWKTGLEVGFEMDHSIQFEDDATFTVNEDSEMEIKDTTRMGFKVTEESDEEAAVVTISDIALYMSRDLAAGAYDLEMTKNSAVSYFNAQPLFGGETVVTELGTCTHTKSKDNLERYNNHLKAECDDDNVVFVGDVTDYSDVVKEGWVNIVTAGRDADDASFTTKVVVPVGESYIVAGEQTVALDVPAYVSAAGYTMLPVRAVAVALGIHNNNVLWDQASKTVTILYGQRIITMTVGAKVINVNGSAIPASASPEVVDGRTFLPMRDLATALGVVDITWDAATKTATLNGNK